MATRPEIIRQATLRSRQAWDNYLVAQQRHIYEIYRSLADDIGVALTKAEKAGKISALQAARLRTKVQGMVGLPKMQLGEVFGKMPPGLFKDLHSSILKGMAASADYAIKAEILAAYAAGVDKHKIKLGTSFIGKDGQVRRYDAAKQNFTTTLWNRVNRDAVAAARDWKPGGVAFSERIWEISYQTQKQVLGAMEQGLIQGKSAASISRDIRQHLALPDTFRGEVLTDFHPGVGMYKSAYKNAMRLARTELARAHTEGTIRYAKTKDWIDGWVWRVGNIDACDICAARNDRFYAKATPPELPAHPHCMCYLELHVRGDEK